MKQDWWKWMVDTNLKQQFPNKEKCWWFSLTQVVQIMREFVQNFKDYNWGSLASDFKKIYDYMANIRHNQDYQTIVTKT